MVTGTLKMTGSYNYLTVTCDQVHAVNRGEKLNTELVQREEDINKARHSKYSLYVYAPKTTNSNNKRKFLG